VMPKPVQDRLDANTGRTAHPNARAGWIMRGGSEALIDFLGRITMHKFETFELVNRRSDSIEVKAEELDAVAVAEYEGKIARAEVVDPPMIDAETGEVYNGRHRLEAYKRRGVVNVGVILCHRRAEAAEGIERR